MVEMTEQEYMAESESYSGFCLGECKSITRGQCEPDAEAYKCPECGGNTVYGIEQLLMLGLVSFV
jgi:hypothetical protein